MLPPAGGKSYYFCFFETRQRRYRTQCASYMVAMNLQKGILWNTRDNTSCEIEVPDRTAFLDAVAKTVTKGATENYYGPNLFEKKANGGSRYICSN